MKNGSENSEGIRSDDNNINQLSEGLWTDENGVEQLGKELRTDVDDVEQHGEGIRSEDDIEHHSEARQSTHATSAPLGQKDEPDVEEDSIPGRFKLQQPNEVKREDLSSLNSWFEGKSPAEILRWGFEQFGSEMVLGTGFGVSGVVLIHTVSNLKLPLTVFYLDTSLLFDETYQLRDQLEELFDLQFERVSTKLTIDQQSAILGKELWKSDPDRCCYIRKVLPLRTYLTDKKAWVTGVRRDQSESRQKTRIFEWDPLNEVIKINPLAYWPNEKVWDYVEKHNLPYNPLHDQGYPSIGCVPCTSPVSGDSDKRSGRWEQRDKNECGIHLPSQTFQNGQFKNGSLDSHLDHQSSKNGT